MFVNGEPHSAGDRTRRCDAERPSREVRQLRSEGERHAKSNYYSNLHIVLRPGVLYGNCTRKCRTGSGHASEEAVTASGQRSQALQGAAAGKVLASERTRGNAGSLRLDSQGDDCGERSRGKSERS